MLLRLLQFLFASPTRNNHVCGYYSHIRNKALVDMISAPSLDQIIENMLRALTVMIKKECQATYTVHDMSFSKQAILEQFEAHLKGKIGDLRSLCGTSVDKAVKHRKIEYRTAGAISMPLIYLPSSVGSFCMLALLSVDTLNDNLMTIPISLLVWRTITIGLVFAEVRKE
jgi:hypothetical protein